MSRQIMRLDRSLKRLFPIRLAVVTALVVALPARAQPRLKLVSDLRLETKAQAFDQAVDMVVAPSGGFLIVDNGMRLHLFDAKGAPVKVVGGRGAGPGEFREMQAYGAIDREYWIYDAGLKRVTHFDLQGAYKGVTTIATEASATRFDLWKPIGITTTGVVTSEAYQLDGGSALKVSRPGDYTPVRTLVQFRRASSSVAVPYPSGGGFTVHIPFVHAQRWDISTAGTHVAIVRDSITSRRGGVYRVTLTSVNGDPFLSRTYPYVGEPIPDSAVERAIAEDVRRKSPANRQAAERALRSKRNEVPAFYQPVLQVLVGQDTTVWLRHRKTPKGIPWSVYGKDGRLAASVVLPANLTIKEASLRQLWAFETDEDGFNNVVRFKLSSGK